MVRVKKKFLSLIAVLMILFSSFSSSVSAATTNSVMWLGKDVETVSNASGGYSYITKINYIKGNVIHRYYGLVDSNANIVIPMKYENLGPLDVQSGLIEIVDTKTFKSGYFNIKTKGEVVPPIYDKITYTNNDCFIVEVGDWKLGKAKDGLLDINGNLIIPIEYNYITPFGDNFLGFKEDGYTLFDKKGSVIKVLDYKSISRLSEGLALVIKDDKSGYINANGEEVIPLIFDRYEVNTGKIDPIFNNGYATVYKDGKCTVIDKSGNFVLDNYYDYVKYAGNNLFIVGEPYLTAWKATDYTYSIIDKSGKRIIDKSYNYIERMSNDVKEKALSSLYKVKISKDNRIYYGIIDINGKEVIPANYYDISTEEGRRDILYANFSVISGNEYIAARQYFTLEGKKIAEASKFGYAYIPKNLDVLLLYNDYNDNSSSRNLKFNGSPLTPYSIKEVFSKDKIVVVDKKGKYGLIDGSGKVILKLSYDYLDFDELGNLWMGKKTKNVMKYGMIDIKGKALSACVYDFYTVSQIEGYIILKKGNKCGIMNSSGKEVVACTYDRITDSKNGVFNVELGKSCGILKILNKN